MKKKALAVYNVGIVLLAIISIIMAILDICGKIAADNTAFYTADNIILGIFAVDYIVRFILAEKKWPFFKENVFDLLAVIPFNSLFTVFRFSRIFRLSKLMKLTKLTKMTRLVGVFGKLQRQINGFLHTNGFIYVLYAAGVLIIISSVIISYVEGKSLGDAVWWSIVTCTTVGYGDISPETGLGRIVAVILMIFGIGLISMLTGTITTFFTAKPEKDELQEIIDRMTADEKQKLTDYAKELTK